MNLSGKKKTVFAVETHCLFSKENILDGAISKEGHAEVFLDMKRAISTDLLISLKKGQLLIVLPIVSS